MTEQEKINKVLEWADNRSLFYQEALRIRTKKGGIVPFCIRPIQEQTNRTIRQDRRAKITKARQLGITTGALAERFHDTLFVPYTKTAMAAQQSSTAGEIFLIVSTFYEFLPDWFKRIPLFKTKKDNANTLHLMNGGIIKVGTANTEFWRGQTFQHAHLTEVAYYDNLKSILGSLAHAVSDEGTITFETSAHGHNQYYDFWVDDSNGYTPIFYSWLEDPGYVADPAKMPRILTEQELTYIEQYTLPPNRAAWFVKTLREKCGNDINLFNQEMPITADVAFIATGARYFPVVFSVSAQYNDGLEVLVKPIPNHKYTIGADPASGSPTGDASAATVLDVTDANHYYVAATYNVRISIPAFAEAIELLSIQYNRAHTNPELNNHGHALIAELLRRNVPLFRDSKFNGKTVHFASQFGTLITENSRTHLLAQLLKAIVTKKLTMLCPRTQAQFNTFVYDKNGKPQHESGKHDDLVFSLAHALYCVQAAPSIALQPVLAIGTMREKLEYELQTGKLWDQPLYDALE